MGKYFGDQGEYLSPYPRGQSLRTPLEAMGYSSLDSRGPEGGGRSPFFNKSRYHLQQRGNLLLACWGEYHFLHPYLIFTSTSQFDSLPEGIPQRAKSQQGLAFRNYLLGR